MSKHISDFEYGSVVAYVRWFDSAIYTGENLKADDLTGVMENESSGILIHDNDNEVALALDRCIETMNLRNVLVIPKVNVRFLRKIRV